MAAAGEVLSAYEQLLQRSARMLAWAREGDWASLIQEESAYVVAVEKLRTLEAGSQLGHEGGQRKADLLERILEQDAEVRQHLEHRRDELRVLMGDARRRRDLSRTYRASGGQTVSINQGRQ